MFTIPRGSCFLVSVAFTAWLSTTAFAQTSGQVVVRPTAAGSTLSFDGVQAFHSTSNPVIAAKSFVVDNVRVAVWRELAGPNEVPYYAIQLADGSMHVVQTDYTVLMQRAQFDPAVFAPDFSRSAVAWDGEVYIVQFETQPLFEYQQALRAAGATVYSYVGNHAQLVRMTPAVKAAVSAMPFVRWVGPFHGEYKIESVVMGMLESGNLDTLRYNVQVFERGMAQKPLVAAKILAVGGVIETMDENGFLIGATLTPAQLRRVAGFDEVAAIDRWSMAEPDMNNVRILGGANSLETIAGYTGTGVRGEVFDGGVLATHSALQHNGGVLLHGAPNSDNSHGTETTGIVFGDGTSNALGRGMLPTASIIGASYHNLIPFFGPTSRYTHTADLVDPLQPYKCVFQSNSWGSSLVTTYTTESFEMDDIIFQNDILILNSQSNANSTLSRPEAWAKNVVSIGGINHLDNTVKGDDNWNGASIGPAADGRIKPDLAFFYDSILTTSSLSTTAYDPNFGGTSAATPASAGHFGLFFQMWSDGVFGNAHPGATVFENRPHFTLAKAAMINTASQWTFSGTAHNLTRVHQGWGMPNVQSLYDRKDKTFFVNETDPLNNLQTKTYQLSVAPGEPLFAVTMVYRDLAGTVSASQHRFNDLSLRVTDPSSTVSYWGNNGLLAGNYSTSGGVANTKDTVENVFVRLPVAGTWTIEVIGSDINTDVIASLPGNNADFSLWATGGTTLCPAPTSYCAGKLNSIGTIPAISSTGSTSFAINNFAVTMTNGTHGKPALVFRGPNQLSQAFHGGTLCIAPPTKRGSVITTTASGAGTWAYAIQASDVGNTLNFQWWMRDNPDPFGDGLSNALSATFCN
ncbi:MAG: S8 family serine peptidase [Planctomycetes bacterium]|nr:S8 family serine peptidase [Planctomycetota bacterium]